MKPQSPQPRRLVMVANCVYGEHVAGGDVHFFQMAQAAIRAGHPVHFFGGHCLASHLKAQQIACSQTLTDTRTLGRVDMGTLGGQWRLLRDYFGKFRRTMRQRTQIQHDDLAYAVTDYWFDAWPVIFSRARQKLMILGMDSPTLSQVIFRGRPDVPKIRLNSIYYWLSQSLSLRLFRRCRHKRLLYVHPAMKPRLLRMGYREDEIVFVSNGFDLKAVQAVPEPPKAYDAIWIGRLHQQKGIADLLATLSHLAQSVKDFRAVLVGKLQDLVPELRARNLLEHVEMPGLVSDSEKFRLFKASRVMLMPSQYESWGIVIAEALGSGTPVVAYQLEPYKPIFGDLVRYVPPFDAEQFKRAAADEVLRSRAGNSSLHAPALQRFREEASWEAAGTRFLSAVRSLESAVGNP